MGKKVKKMKRKKKKKRSLDEVSITLKDIKRKNFAKQGLSIKTASDASGLVVHKSRRSGVS